MFEGEDKTAKIALATGGGVLAFILIAAMMPGMLLVILFGGAETKLMPDDALALCQEVFSWPLADYGPESVLSGFGPRKSPGGIGSTNHQGIDIAAPGGTEILAVCDGVVVKSTYNAIRGNYVEIDHGGGITTLYQHMSQRKCTVGDTVSQGDVIGLVGTTGNSTGNHLHFEVKVNNTCYDPMQVYEERSGAT